MNYLAAALCLLFVAMVAASPIKAPPAAPQAFSTWSASITTSCGGPGCSASKSSGIAAWDATLNKTTWNPSKSLFGGQAFVADFNMHRAYFLQGAQGFCSYFCSLAPVSTMCNEQLDNPNLCSFDYTHKAKYVGSGTTKSGKAADHYHQNSGIIPGLPMAKYDYYMDPTTHEPMQIDLVLQPFGKVIGNFSSTFENFSTSSPDPSLFTVGNIKYCQQGTDSQCGNVNERLSMAMGAPFKVD